MTILATIQIRLSCSSCGTHVCQSCGMVWRPAVVPTVGVRFLPGLKNE